MRKRRITPVARPAASAGATAASPAAPVDAGALLRRADEQLAAGRTDEACALGQTAAERAPASAAVWEFLGRCYMRVGAPEKARASYQKSLALDPDGPQAVFIRAMLKKTVAADPSPKRAVEKSLP